MAKQGFQGEIIGTIGDLSYSTRKGSGGKSIKVVGKKGGVSSARIKNDPAFARVKENNNEFADAAAYTKGFYNSVQGVVSSCKDGYTYARLQKCFLASKSQDPTSDRGSRSVQLDILDQDLEGFQFNPKKSLNSAVRVKLEATANKTTGVNTLVIPEMKPKIHLGIPTGATHAKIYFSASANAVDTTDFEVSETSTDFIDLSSGAVLPSVTLTATTSAGTAVNVCTAGIQYYQKVNNQWVELNNRSFNTAQIIAVG